MAACIAGREVVLRFRHRATGKRRTASVVCPARWPRSRLLDYARRHHPGETVCIETWYRSGRDDNLWEPRLWLVDPEEMTR